MADQSDPFKSTIDSIAPGKLDALKDSFFTDLKESGTKHVQAAERFQAGLDKVVDVLLILVMKFGRATTVLIIMGVINIVCLTINIIATVQIAALRSEVRDLMDRQEAFARSQQRIEKTTTETKQDIATTSQKVAETQAKVNDVAATAPKVEVDARTGKAKLVVSVPDKKKTTKPSTPKVTTPAENGKKQVEINLE